MDRFADNIADRIVDNVVDSTINSCIDNHKLNSTYVWTAVSKESYNGKIASIIFVNNKRKESIIFA